MTLKLTGTNTKGGTETYFASRDEDADGMKQRLIVRGLKDLEVSEATALDLRRQQFIDLISAYSEERWSAGWSSGIEQELRAQGGIWLGIAATTGWPLGYRGEGGWEKLSDEEWATLTDLIEEAPS